MYLLHNHTADGSNQRLIDSINRPKELIQYAFDLGLDGIAITDHESLKAHVKASQFVQKKKELAKEGKEDARWLDFKLIFGNEIYLCRNGLYKDNITKEDKFYHFILLAKDEFGHELLRRLSTRAFSHSFMRSKMRRVPTYYSDLEEIVVPNRGHLIASSACIGGFLGQKILKMRKENNDTARQELEEEIKEWIEYIRWIFGPQNFFLELQPSHNKEQVFVNDYLIKLAGELGVRPIITTDSHYLKKEERNIHKLFLQSKEGDREVDEFYAATYLMDEQEIHSYMDEYLPPEVIEECFANTRLIGEQIEEFWLGKPFKLPYMPSEHDKQIANSPVFRRLPGEIDHEIWEKFIYSKEPSDRVLIHRILDKCWTDIEQFGAPKSIEEIEIELRTIWAASEKQNLVWSRYFLQVADYIEIAWNEGDTIISPARGSAASFYINYLLDIIQVNPLREPVKTYYWRLTGLEVSYL